MDYIIERLAVGDINDARNVSREITALLNCSDEHDTFREGIAYLKIPLVDFQPIDPAYIPRAVAWIKEVIVDHKVLVHCNAGIGRSPSIVVCYLCEVGFGFEEAVRLVKARRLDAVPHRNLKSAILLARRVSAFK